MQNIRTTSDIATLLLERLQSNIEVNTINDDVLEAISTLIDETLCNRRMQALTSIWEGYDN